MDDEPESDEIGSISHAAKALRLSKGHEPVESSDDQAWIEAAQENARSFQSAVLSEKHSVSKDEREALHRKLDYLLTTRTSLNRIDPSALTKGYQFYFSWSGPRSELFEDGSKFLREIIGPELHHVQIGSSFDNSELTENYGEGDHLANVANAIRSFLPLFISEKSTENGQQYISKIVDDFLGIYWGDAPRFFGVLPKRQGEHKRPFRLAYLRKQALDWEAYLKKQDMPAYERQGLISSAYRTSWDAIRKWKVSIFEQFDLVPETYTISPDEKKAFNGKRAELLEMIVRDGSVYYAEINNR